MGFFILIAIVAIAWFLYKVSNNNSSNPLPPTTRQYQNGLKKNSTPTPKENVVYKIPRDRLLKLLGWDNSSRRYFIGENSISLDVLKGYTHKPIVGTFYRPNITIFDTGWFNGYATIDPENKYDQFAVAVYRDDHKMLGYIPKGDLNMFHYIHDNGGYVHAYGTLAYDCWGDKWFGFVAIENDASQIEYRNALFENKTVTFYDPVVNITDFLNDKQKK